MKTTAEEREKWANKIEATWDVREMHYDDILNLLSDIDTLKEAVEAAKKYVDCLETGGTTKQEMLKRVKCRTDYYITRSKLESK